MNIDLLSGTGTVRLDRLLRGVVGAYEAVFVDRVRGFYLRGSYAAGGSVAGSDLDLLIVFKDRLEDQAESERAYALARALNDLSPVLLEVIVIGEQGLRENGSLAVDAKLGTQHIYGEDIRDALPDFDEAAYLRAVVHTPYFSYSFPAERGLGSPITYPLTHLRPSAEFFGFDQWLLANEDGVEGPSTKLLMATVTWTATALVALNGGGYVKDKATAVNLYEEIIHDEWTPLVRAVYELCRNRWAYRIPTGLEDRRQLHELCDAALGFQNHYLRRYRAF